MKRTLRPVVIAAFLALALLVALSGSSAGPPGNQAASDLQRAISVQERHTPQLLSLPGVVGTGVGIDDEGRTTVKIFVTSSEMEAIPPALEGIPVEAKITSEFRALHHRPGHGGDSGGGGTDPTKRFPRPVPIGVSSGNQLHGFLVAGVGACFTGTYGARVKEGTSVYALSNNHVYAMENAAPIGSPIVQPGLADNGCKSDPKDVIAHLSEFVPIGPVNEVDAAIAISSTDQIGNSTPTGGYGTPKSAVTPATLKLAVQKYGRTTRLTKGLVTSINVTSIIIYNTGPRLFTGQIAIELPRKVKGTFSDSGDSGSLVVTDPGNSPVGLLFAGSDDVTLANPIQKVLNAFGVTIDGV